MRPAQFDSLLALQSHTVRFIEIPWTKHTMLNISSMLRRFITRQCSSLIFAADWMNAKEKREKWLTSITCRTNFICSCMRAHFYGARITLVISSNWAFGWRTVQIRAAPVHSGNDFVLFWRLFFKIWTNLLKFTHSYSLVYWIIYWFENLFRL